MFLISFILALREELEAKVIILGIPPLTLFTLALKVVLVAKLVISDILSSNLFYFCIIYIFFNNISFTTLLSLLRSTGTGANQHLIYLICFSNSSN